MAIANYMTAPKQTVKPVQPATRTQVPGQQKGQAQANPTFGKPQQMTMPQQSQRSVMDQGSRNVNPTMGGPSGRTQQVDPRTQMNPTFGKGNMNPTMGGRPANNPTMGGRPANNPTFGGGQQSGGYTPQSGGGYGGGNTGFNPYGGQQGQQLNQFYSSGSASGENDRMYRPDPAYGGQQGQTPEMFKQGNPYGMQSFGGPPQGGGAITPGQVGGMFNPMQGGPSTQGSFGGGFSTQKMPGGMTKPGEWNPTPSQGWTPQPSQGGN
jgi:hypothetical protein